MVAATAPPVTSTLLGINIIVFVITYVASIRAAAAAALSWSTVVEHGEIYRMIASSFVHNGPLHIFMNMTTLIQLGKSLETTFGSLQFLGITLVTLIITSVVQLILLGIFAKVSGSEFYYYMGSVGFSGVLFAYATIEANHTSETTRSVMGAFQVPAKLHPFILLVIMQFMLPNVSFVGHLAGILTGLLLVHGFLSFLLPSQDGYIALERYTVVQSLVSRQRYVPVNMRSPVLSNGFQGSWTALMRAGPLSMMSAVIGLLTPLLHLVGFPVEKCHNQCVLWYNITYNQCSRYFCFLKAFTSIFTRQNSSNSNNNNNSFDPENIPPPSNRPRTLSGRPSQAVSSGSQTALSTSASASIPSQSVATATTGSAPSSSLGYYVNPNRVKALTAVDRDIELGEQAQGGAGSATTNRGTHSGSSATNSQLPLDSNNSSGKIK